MTFMFFLDLLIGLFVFLHLAEYGSLVEIRRDDVVDSFLP